MSPLPGASTSSDQNVLAAVASVLTSVVEMSLASLPKCSGQFGRVDDSWEVCIRKFEQRCRGLTVDAKIEAIRDLLEGDAKAAFQNMTADEKSDFDTFTQSTSIRLQRSSVGSITHL